MVPKPTHAQIDLDIHLADCMGRIDYDRSRAVVAKKCS